MHDTWPSHLIAWNMPYGFMMYITDLEQGITKRKVQSGHAAYLWIWDATVP